MDGKNGAAPEETAASHAQLSRLFLWCDPDTGECVSVGLTDYWPRGKPLHVGTLRSGVANSNVLLVEGLSGGLVAARWAPQDNTVLGMWSCNGLGRNSSLKWAANRNIFVVPSLTIHHNAQVQAAYTRNAERLCAAGAMRVRLCRTPPGGLGKVEVLPTEQRPNYFIELLNNSWTVGCEAAK